MQLSLGKLSTLKHKHPAPRISLILACPRPLRLERIFPIVSCQGVSRIAIIGAEKVEKAYFGQLTTSLQFTSFTALHFLRLTPAQMPRPPEVEAKRGSRAGRGGLSHAGGHGSPELPAAD
jgi:hypothetical protein